MSEFRCRLRNLRRMAEGGWTVREIAEWYGVTNPTILRALREAGLKTRGHVKGRVERLSMPPGEAIPPLPVVAPGEPLVDKPAAAPPAPFADDDEDWPRMPSDDEIRRHVDEGLSYAKMADLYGADTRAIADRGRALGIRRQAGGQRLRDADAAMNERGEYPTGLEAQPRGAVLIGSDVLVRMYGGGTVWMLADGYL